jgi:hypothetical protein
MTMNADLRWAGTGGEDAPVYRTSLAAREDVGSV